MFQRVEQRDAQHRETRGGGQQLLADGLGVLSPRDERGAAQLGIVQFSNRFDGRGLNFRGMFRKQQLEQHLTVALRLAFAEQMNGCEPDVLGRCGGRRRLPRREQQLGECSTQVSGCHYLAQEGICFGALDQAVHQDKARKVRFVALRQPRGGFVQVTLVPARADQHRQIFYKRGLFIVGCDDQLRASFRQCLPEQPRSWPDTRENREGLPTVGRTSLSEPRQCAKFLAPRQSSKRQCNLNLDARVGIPRKCEDRRH